MAQPSSETPGTSPAGPTRAFQRGLLGRWSRLDRLAVMVLLVVMTVWSACVWVLAGQAFGCCWSGMAEVACAHLVALAVAVAVPGWFVRLVLGATARLRPGDALAIELALAGRKPGDRLAPGPGRWLLNLLAASALACVAGGLATLAGILPAGWALRGLARVFILSGWSWAAMRVGLEVLLMLPMGFGLAALMLTASLLRRFAPNDPYRLLTRDLLWVLAAGLVLASVAWWLRLNLLGVALVCAVVVMGLVLATFTRSGGGVQQSGLTVSAPVGKRRMRQRWMNACAWAVLAATVLLQGRALRDVGADWGWTWAWAGGLCGLLGLAAGRPGRRVQAGGTVEFWAAAGGAIVLAGLQVTLLALAALQPSWAWAWVSLAAAGQVPLAALWATALDSRRRAFAASGYPGRGWLADAAIGAAAGGWLVLAALSVPRGPQILSAGAMGLLAGTVLAGAAAAARQERFRGAHKAFRGQLRWAQVGALGVLAAVMSGIGLTVATARGLGGRPAVGASWTGCRTAGGRIAVLPTPVASVPPVGDLDVLAGRLVRSGRGRWWLVGTDLPALGLDRTATALSEVTPIDPVFSALQGRAGGGRGLGGFPHRLAMETRWFEGICLSGLPADHPDAWCLYNRQVLRQCLDRLRPEGLLVLRTWGRTDHARAVMALAETFRSTFEGHGQAAVALEGDVIELALVVRRGRDRRASGEVDLSEASGGLGVRVMGVPDLVVPGMGGAAWSILTGPRLPAGTVTTDGLAYWLERKDAKKSSAR